MNLDTVRSELHDWYEDLRVEDGETIGYRMGRGGRANLLSTTDVAWIRYALNDLDGLSNATREKWARWIQNEQKADGHFEYTEAVGEGNMHSHGHAFWHANRALRILGSEIRIFPEYLRPATTTAGLTSWFAAWEAQVNRTHHDVLGLIPILANTDDAAWVECFYRDLARQQDPDTGTWPRGGPTNISRTFAYSVIFRANSRIPPQPEKIIDAMLRLQAEDGFWHDRNHSFFSTMDAIYVLTRLPRLTGYKEAEAMGALVRIKAPMAALYRRREDRLFGNTHGMLAVVHALGLLSETFPEEFPASKPWRFDWDKPDLFRCDLIRQALKSPVA
mgnify:CR=1 FL=1